MYIQKVANDFVREYYTRLYNSPSSLYELYAADSALIHGDEGDKQGSKVTKGEGNIKSMLTREDFANSMVRVTDVSSVPSTASTFSILVMGDLKAKDKPPRMFVQSFVVFNNDKKGPLILTDILRYPQQEYPEVEEPPRKTTPTKSEQPAAKHAVKAAPKHSDEAEPSANAKGRRASSETASSTPAPTNGAASGRSSHSESTPASGNDDSVSDDAELSSSEQSSEKSDKGKKFKFSFDTIANAPSFRPKSSVVSPPTYPVNYAMGGYSPTYQPIHGPMQVSLPYQMQQMMHQGSFVPPMHPGSYMDNVPPQDGYRGRQA